MWNLGTRNPIEPFLLFLSFQAFLQKHKQDLIIASKASLCPKNTEYGGVKIKFMLLHS